MPPFRYENNTDPRLAGTIADLMLRGPAARAAAAERIGAIQAQGANQVAGAWSGAAQNIGQMIGAIPGQIQQGKRAELQDQIGALQLGGAQQAASDDAMFRKALSMSQGGDLAPAVDFLKSQGGAGVAALQKLTGMVQAQKQQHDEAAGELGYRLFKAPTPDTVKSVLDDVVKSGDMKPDDAARYHAMSVEDPSKIKDLARDLMAHSPSMRALLDQTITAKPGEQVFSKLDPTKLIVSAPEKKPDYTINGQRFSGDGTPIGDVQPPQTPPKSLEAKEGFVIKGTTNVPTFNPADGSWAFNGKPVAADQVVRATPPKDPIAQALQSVALETARLNLNDKQRRDANITAITEGVKQGTIPPDPEGLGRQGLYGEVVAQLQKDGVNFNILRQQYMAQKRLIQTENSPQGVRLDIAVRSGLAMYDKVDELSKQWDSKGWGALSRANLKLATEGYLGKDAQKVATELKGQIAQLTSDVATVEQNGMTPTNEARAVAEQGLQAWWGDGTIQAMTKQGRANMRIRDAARKETAPLVPGSPAAAGASTLQPNMTHVVEQNGVRYGVTTDASGKVLRSVPVSK